MNLTKPVIAYIDSDAANEIDDPFAIVRALVAPEFQIVGLSSIGWKAPSIARQISFEAATYESQQVNEDVLSLMKMKDKISHPVGALSPMKDMNSPVDSPAARDIIAKANAMPAGEKLQVYTLGALTNVASALLLDPTLKDRAAFYIIGYMLKDGRLETNEFNAQGDLYAADYMLRSGAETHVMPANILYDFKWSNADTARRLSVNTEMKDYLMGRWNGFIGSISDELKAEIRKIGLGEGEWIMWDVALFEAMLVPSLAEADTFEINGNPIRIWTSIDAPGMLADFWAKVLH